MSARRPASPPVAVRSASVATPPPPVAEALRRAARRYGTPLFVTDLAELERAAGAVRDAFPDPWLRQYSVKANDVPAIIAAVGRTGFGANVVSLGEWALARRAGIPNARISLEGIGKTDADLDAAARATADGDGLLWLALESLDELSALSAAARAMGLGRDGRPRLDVLFRLNPDVQPDTHASLAVGRGGSKFGMTETELTEAVERARFVPGLVSRGLHVHVGSQLGAVDAWRDGARRALAIVALIRAGQPAFDTLDIGGGFPVAPAGRSAPDPVRFARELPALVAELPDARRPARLAVEPGRVAVARAGWLVASVLHVRERDERLVVLDAGMTEIIRPALYGARHDVVALTSLGRAVDADGSMTHEEPTAVHGPICESTDALGRHRLPALGRGDLIAIADAGAYAASMASAYNGRPRAPQVLLAADGSLILGRRRGRIGR